MTIPNTILNTSSSDDDKIKPETRFFSGDWTSLEREFLSREIISEEQKFDLILTSETIYNTENQSKLVSIFKQLKRRLQQAATLKLNLLRLPFLPAWMKRSWRM